MNIAIFGGSFDPFHIGHKKIVSLALEELDISKLFIVPTFLNPFKDSSFLDANTRLELLNNMYENDKDIEIISYEVNNNERTPTYKTLQYLKKNYSLNKIYLIIGADNLKDIHLWYNFKNLVQEVEFVVVSRDSFSLENEHIKALHLKLNEEISSSTLREKMQINCIPKKIQKKVKELWKK